jgi:acetyl-CoA synthetase
MTKNRNATSIATMERPSRLDDERYAEMYRSSIESPDEFWRQHARRIDWIKPFTRVQDCSFDKENLHIAWFDDGVLNASANCLDRHLNERGDKTAFIWEGDAPGESKSVTFAEAHVAVCRFANVLKQLGVHKGDRVIIYLPMILEAAYAMLACARIGAVHSVVFGGFSPEALAGRIADCGSSILITADEGVRAGKLIPLKLNVDAALALVPGSEATVLVVRNTGAAVTMIDERDVWLHDRLPFANGVCPAEPMRAEDPLFILYTSGSTGKPKGVVHTTGGYMVWASMTHEYAFDLREDDVFWCTADLGWVTGHTYLLYGALANGSTTLIFEGVPTYPDASRFWRICDDHKVTILYTAPTAIRALMREGDGPLEGTDRSSLRMLGSVGEPINPEAWQWYHDVVGQGRCPIVDTWWQTETGGCMMAPWPNTNPVKPGAASRPFFGVVPALLDPEGRELDGEALGNLVLTGSWPGQARTIYGDHHKFFETYFASYPGCYFTGDGARRDSDGTYWITGRVDDVLNVSGHRLGTAEIENALSAHPAVAEAAVVGCPHDIKGQGIYAYISLRSEVLADEALRLDLLRQVRSEIGPIAVPDTIQFVANLPKTRSGKIVRRILRKIAEGAVADFGDASTLADPGVVIDLLNGKARAAPPVGKSVRNVSCLPEPQAKDRVTAQLLPVAR